jgi:uncharacterized protein (DUF1697 family)
MPRFAAFLRGMNLGNRRITNEALREHVAALAGVEDVATFRASGNVIFSTSAARDPGELAAHVEAGLAKALGYDVPVFLRSAEEVRAIAAHAPFTAEQRAGFAGKLQVALLLAPPPTAARRAALALATDEDLLAIDGRELYWLPRGRMSDSELDLDALAKALGPMTIRTIGTMEQIAARSFADC